MPPRASATGPPLARSPISAPECDQDLSTVDHDQRHLQPILELHYRLHLIRGGWGPQPRLQLAARQAPSEFFRQSQRPTIVAANLDRTRVPQPLLRAW